MLKKVFLFITTYLSLFCCKNNTPNNGILSTKTIFPDTMLYHPKTENITEFSEQNMQKMIDSITMDDSSIENQFLGYELIDLNYDTYKDVVIYKNGCGTGVLRLVDIYFYNPQIEKFVYNDQLSAVTNPSFYIEDSLITGFYIGHGGGDCIKLKWVINKWETAETITIKPSDKRKLHWDVTIKDHQTMTTKNTTMKLFVIPDTALLKNKY